MPYEQINLKNSNYSVNIDTLNHATKLNDDFVNEDFKSINVNVEKLKNILNNHKSILKKKEKELKNEKIQMKEEMDENIKSLQILSGYEK